MVFIREAFDGLTGALDRLTSPAKKIAAMGDQFTRASAALGKTFESTFSEFEGSMDGLRGSLDQRFRANIRTLEAGLQGNAAGVAKLINQQELTNTAFAKTARALANMESALGLSREETNNLALGMIDTGSKFQISTDKLVNVVSELESTFPVQALAGFGPQVTEAVTLMLGKVGPQLAPSLMKSIKFILDPGRDAFDRLSRLGIEGVRDRLEFAETADDALRLFESAFKTADISFRQMAQGPFMMIGEASRNFGDAGLHITAVTANLDKRIEQEVEATDLYAKTISNLYKEIFVPFESAFIKFHPTFVEITEIINNVFVSLGKEFEAFVDTIRTSGGARLLVDNTKLMLLDIGIAVREAFDNIMGTAENGFNGVFGPGGILDKMKVVFSDLAVSFHDLRHPFGGDSERREALFNMAKEERMQMIAEATFQRRKGMNAIEITMDQVEDKYRRKISTEQMQFNKSYAEKMSKIAESSERKQSEAVTELKNQRFLLKTQMLFNQGLNFLMQQSVDTQEKIKENTGVVADTIGKNTAPQFLDDTAAILGPSMERILFGGGSVATAMIVEAIDNQTEVMDAGLNQSSSRFADSGS